MSGEPKSGLQPLSGLDDPILPVVIVHWNAPGWLSSAAASIVASADVCIELTVVDNGSSRPPESADLPSGTRLICMPENGGYTKGANVGLRDWLEDQRNLPYCVVGSHDLHLAPHTLATLLRVVSADPRIGIGGAWRSYGSRETGEVAGEPLTVSRPWVSGQCMLLRRQCVAEVGLFDERFHSYVEDVDLCYRARRAGWGVVAVPSAPMWGLGSVDDRARKRAEANDVLFQVKHHGRWAGAKRLGRLVGDVPRHAVGAVALWRTVGERHASARALTTRAGAVVDGWRFLRTARASDQDENVPVRNAPSKRPTRLPRR